ncbi:MAG: cytochrome oxidase subunit III [Flavobacteriales bacterium BRH_c54]|nr:MAG: cytochrome oxidase subunit III [Flavobacteriales bacterium BRH_c54]
MSNSTVMDSKTAWGGNNVSPYGASYGKLMMWFFLISDALTFTGFLSAYGFYRHYYSSIWPSAENVFTHFPFMHGNHPLLYVALMTFILIMSSVTMVLAVEAGHRMDKKGVTLWLGLTLIGGAIFLGSQAWEWYHFIHGTELGAIELGKGYFTLPDGTIESTKGIIARWTDESRQMLLLPWKDGADYITVTGTQMNEFVTNGKEIHGANLTHNEYGHPLFGDFFFFITGFHGTHVFSGVVINFIVFVNVIMGTYQKRGHYEMVEKVGLYWHFVDLVWVFVFTFFYLI